MSKYKIIAFILMVGGLVLILIGLNKNNSPQANANNNTNPTPEQVAVPDQPTEPEQQAPIEDVKQLSDTSVGYWYQNDDDADLGNYVHVTTNTPEQLAFDWVVNQTNETGEIVPVIEATGQVTTRVEEKVFYATFNGVEYTIKFNEPDYTISVNYNGQEYTYSYYRENAREG